MANGLLNTDVVQVNQWMQGRAVLLFDERRGLKQ